MKTKYIAAALVALSVSMLSNCRSPEKERADDFVEAAEKHEKEAARLRESAERELRSKNSAFRDLKDDIKRELKEELEEDQRRERR
jgi:hypothetical protein